MELFIELHEVSSNNWRWEVAERDWIAGTPVKVRTWGGAETSPERALIKALAKRADLLNHKS